MVHSLYIIRVEHHHYLVWPYALASDSRAFETQMACMTDYFKMRIMFRKSHVRALRALSGQGCMVAQRVYRAKVASFYYLMPELLTGTAFLIRALRSFGSSVLLHRADRSC